MSTLKISVPQAKAFAKVCNKKSTKYYERAVNVRPCGTLTASNSYSILRMKGAIEISDNILTERACGARIAAIDTARKVSEAQGQAGICLPLITENMEPGCYPPSDPAFPSSPTFVGQYDLDVLINLLQAMKLASTGKTVAVRLSTDAVNGPCRPMLLELAAQLDVQGLIAPIKV